MRNCRFVLMVQSFPGACVTTRLGILCKSSQYDTTRTDSVQHDCPVIQDEKAECGFGRRATGDDTPPDQLMIRDCPGGLLPRTVLGHRTSVSLHLGGIANNFRGGQRSLGTPSARCRTVIVLKRPSLEHVRLWNNTSLTSCSQCARILPCGRCSRWRTVRPWANRLGALHADRG